MKKRFLKINRIHLWGRAFMAWLLISPAIIGFNGYEAMASGVTQLPAEVSLEEETIGEEPREIPESYKIMDGAASLYEAYKRAQFDGDAEDITFPKAYAAVQKALEAMGAEGADDVVRGRCSTMVSDLNQALSRGAVYFSGNGNQAELNKFARLYIDSQIHPAMAGYSWQRDERLFPTLAYVAASSAFNARDLEAAKNYFEVYLQSGDQKYREAVLAFLAQTCLDTGEPLRAVQYVKEGVAAYPTNPQLVNLALECALRSGSYEEVQPLLDRALLLQPGDERLMLVQAQHYERLHDYKPALDIYNQLVEKHPESLTFNEHVAQCYYNLGVGYYNRSIISEDEKEAKRARRQSKAYFETAMPKLEEILANMPNSEKYLRALGVTYGLLEIKDKFEKVNNRMKALGKGAIALNQMPGMIGEGEGTVAAKPGASQSVQADVPSFDEFAKSYVEPRIAQWGQRGEFETVAEYSKRMESGVSAQLDMLVKTAADEYLKKYSNKLRLSDMKLSPYDVENETFRISTSYGPVVVKVPNKNHEAELFKAGWDVVQLRAPRFMIKDNTVAIASVTFRTPGGKNYVYDAQDAAEFSVPQVMVDANSLIEAERRRQGHYDLAASNTTQKGDARYVGMKSDVDEKIPLTTRQTDNTFALIIANEDYAKSIPVASAYHDGEIFKQYCVRTLGIPEDRVLFYPNATLNAVYESLEILKNRVLGSGKNPEIIFYYAGHGLPDEKTKTAYMMPVDANPILPKTWVPMKEIYKELTSMPNDGVMAFVDACFSGSARSDEKDAMLNEARAVVLKPKDTMPAGSANLFVLAAASGNETALPYKEKNHGLFTYFLLKKLQDSKGGATLGDISKYVTDQVKSVSTVHFNKTQTPGVTANGRMSTDWQNRKLKK